MTGKQSWITYASNDDEALKAIIVSRSLKHVITRKSLTVFVSHEVTDFFSSLLEDEFHWCVRLDKWKCQKFEKTPFRIIALIHSWNLVHLQKFVFLDCNCMVVRNSDELFKTIGASKHFRSIDPFRDFGLSILPVIVDKPSLSKFKKLSDVGTLIESISNFLPYPPLEERYCTGINLKNGFIAKDIKDVNILHFSTLHPMEIFVNHSDQQFRSEETGIMEKATVCLFLDLFAADELPNKIKPHMKIHHEYHDRMLKMRKIIHEISYQSDPQEFQINSFENLQDSIAIVGMSFRLPGANNLDEFWDLLSTGKEGIIKVPDFRWNANHCFSRSENVKDTEAGFLNCPIDDIDAKFFGLSPKEVALMDPQQRLILEVTWESLEHACINPGDLKNFNAGVFGGWWRNDYKEILQEGGLNPKEFFRTYMGNALGTLTGRISHILNATGPSISTESGCSTSIVAVDMACKSLANEDCDLALSFGVNLLLHPFSIQTMNSIIAMDGRSKAFDADADGFGRAEGCTVLVLKRFPDAVRDGDRIWGLIRGSAVVQEGPSRSMGTPTVQCEALAMKLALERAGVEPNEVSFVEAHGTGTPVGDPMEIAAVAEVYSKDRKNTLTIGSVKTNIGHTESCSGIAGIIKTVLSLQHEVIPKHLHLKKLNPEIHLDSIPATIPLSPMKWEKSSTGIPRIAGVSSFGITGTDAHAIIQETPDMATHGLQIKRDAPYHILKASAKCPEALEVIRNSFTSILNNETEHLQDIVYTANIGKGDYSYRCFSVGQNSDELSKALKNNSEPKPIPKGPPTICFLFTGQGSQYPGMAKDLYEDSPTFKMHFDSCDNILRQRFAIDIKKAMWGDKTEDLKRTIYSQTSIFCVEYCLLKLWESWGIKPDCVVGHSLGEFAASVAAGILIFEDALTLVAERSRLIDGLPRGKMIVLKKNAEKVKLLISKAFPQNGHWLDFAAVNAADQTVLAGFEESVKAFATFCENNQTKTHILEATHAFHSRHMDPILEEYGDIASKLTYLKPKYTFISGMEGRKMEEGEVDADYWVQHTRKGVEFMEASKTALKSGYTFFLEIGPHPVLSALTLINADAETSEPIICLPSLRKKELDWPTILNTLGRLYVEGFDINWQNFHQFSTAKRITLPFYPFQKKPFWFDFEGNNNRPFHPLIGASITNPSQLKLFRNDLDLDNAPFLKDHLIGTKIVCPGAGFLEMCLVSGFAACQCLEGSYAPPITPISIEDFFIEAPLAFKENETTQLQEIVSTEDNGETRVTIYSKLIIDKENSKWIRHASGVFSSYAVQWKGEERYKNDTLDNIMARCNEKLDTDKMYDKLADAGLIFGPTFRTIQSAWKGDGEAYCKVAVTDNPNSYICHPVMIDAMFQAMFVTNAALTKLHVPISVSKFIWYSKITTETCFIHGRSSTVNINGTPESELTAILYDSNGQRIAVMTGPAFVETTVSSILSVIEGQRVSLPSMFEDVWRETLGPLSNRCDPSLDRKVFSSELKKEYAVFEILDTAEMTFYEKSNRLYLFYMLKGLIELGWIPNIDESFKLNELRLSLGVLPELKSFLRYILMELSEEGFLRIVNWDRESMTFQLVRALPSKQSVETEIQTLYLGLKDQNAEIDAVSATGLNLAQILTGKKSALGILFPENGTTDSEYQRGPAITYYYEAHMILKTSKMMENLWPIIVRKFNESASTGKTVVRILEVGAGTGAFTHKFLHKLGGNPAQYEYTFTDISKVFFSHGKNVFKDRDSKIKVIYKTLNIEEDPLSQGFIPHHYDIICASHVIHSTSDIRKSLLNLKNLLSPNGCIMIVELTKPLRAINLLFGAVEGFSKFTDYDLRPYNCELSEEKWEEVLRGINFPNVTSFPCYSSHNSMILAENSLTLNFIPSSISPLTIKTWVLISDHDEYFQTKFSEMGRNVVIVKSSNEGFKALSKNLWGIRRHEFTDIKAVFDDLKTNNCHLEGVIYLWGYEDSCNEDYQSTCLPFLNLCKVLITLDHLKLYVFTRGTYGISDDKLSLPVNTPIIGVMKSMLNEYHHINGKCIDLDPSHHSSQDEVLKEGLLELFNNDSETVVAYRSNQRYVHRLIQCRIPKTALNYPQSNRFSAIIPPSNAISDLKFGPTEPIVLNANEVEIRVKAYGLNFKDVLTILKPTSDFDNMDTLGLDYSGVVTAVGSAVKLRKIGDEVFGINRYGGAYPTHLKIDEELTMRIPTEISLWEAATLPAVAITAYICLVKFAKLKEHETILIHTGSGGVGLLAIQMAQFLNCEIVTTAGSARKRAYLQNLGIKHIFNSRNTNYQTEIREALGGRGVDVVLNSLTSPGFKEATLSLCNTGARFIEMSLINVWTIEEVATLRPDVIYEAVHFHEDPDSKFKEYLQEVQEFLETYSITPIPYVRFDASEIRGALTFMQKAKHIGKIIIAMPEPSCSRVNIDYKTPLFNDQSTYLITGGLGGIGMEVAKWMVTTGAKHIVLVGRNPPTENKIIEIQNMNASGAHIISLQCDVGDLEQCKSLMETIRLPELNLPPLRGIMHAAGVISDAFIENQNWEKYEKTLSPKVKGGWNLHKLSLDYRLEHFVMFSSMVANFGSLGQSSHCAANLFLDCLAEYRHSIGLPATTINWGQWGQVGVAAAIEVIGVRPMSTLQTIRALESILRSQRLQTCVAEMNLGIVKKSFVSLHSYFEELKLDHEENASKLQIDSEAFWKEYDGAEGTESKINVIKKYLYIVIRQILKLEDNEAIDDNAHFQEMGMDSLMMIEMKNSVQTIFAHRAKITVSSVKDCLNINQLSVRLVEIVSGTELLPPPTREELADLIREDSALPVEIQPKSEACKASEIRTVLITGVTGNFGPYVLREISKRSQIEKIYCLMRPSAKQTPEQRLRNMLNEKSLLSEIRMEIVECVDGNVTEDKFGFSEEVYTRLAKEVDAVFNLAVKADVQELYRRANASDHNTRTVNVTGLKHVLTFATTDKLKHIYHASTLLVALEVNEEGLVSENWPEVSDFDNYPNSAYPVSKFICDLLMAQAVERGLPCKVFRFPFMGVDSKTGGNVTVLSSHLLLRMMAYMHIGMIPAVNIPFPIIPIDLCANFASRIFFNDDTGFEVYNVSTPFVNDEQELEDIAEELGNPVEVVEPDEFIEKVEKMGNNEMVSFVRNFSQRSKDHKQLEDNIPATGRAWMEGKPNLFLSRKLEKLIPEYPGCLEPSLKLLKKDLQFAKDSGVFAKVGLGLNK